MTKSDLRRKGSFILVFQVTVYPLMEIKSSNLKKGWNLEEESAVGVMEEWLAPRGYYTLAILYRASRTTGQTGSAQGDLGTPAAITNQEKAPHFSP